MFPTIRDGDTERDVHARISLAASVAAHLVHGILNSSSNDVMYGGESDLKFHRGDFVRDDYVAYLNGYAGHQSRLAILGPPNDEQKRGYEMTLEIHRQTIERCLAGVTAGEIYAFVVTLFGSRASTTPHRWSATAWDRGFISRNLFCVGTATS